MRFGLMEKFTLMLRIMAFVVMLVLFCVSMKAFLYNAWAADFPQLATVAAYKHRANVCLATALAAAQVAICLILPWKRIAIRADIIFKKLQSAWWRYKNKSGRHRG